MSDPIMHLTLIGGLRRWNDYCERGDEESLFSFLSHAACIHYYLIGCKPDVDAWEHAIENPTDLRLPIQRSAGFLRIHLGQWHLQTDQKELALRWSALEVPCDAHTYGT